MNSEFADLDTLALARLKDRGFKPQCIFDVGAAHGGWSKKIHGIFREAHFHMFEPAYTEVDDYKTHIDKLIESEPDKFTIHPDALGSTNQIQKIFINRGNPVGNTLLDSKFTRNNWDPVDTHVATIDHIVQSASAAQPDLIKIDVQGGELEVLKGATHTLIDTQVLLLELWLDRGYGPTTPLFHEIINWLLPFGFHVVDFTGTYRKPDNRLISQDMLFAHESAPICEQYKF